ncbi:MAG: hypothetical protein ACI8RD_009163, partial [Bacillariaceae sp.]|jgi:hypothetical protein
VKSETKTSKSHFIFNFLVSILIDFTGFIILTPKFLTIALVNYAVHGGSIIRLIVANTIMDTVVRANTILCRKANKQIESKRQKLLTIILYLLFINTI